MELWREILFPEKRKEKKPIRYGEKRLARRRTFPLELGTQPTLKKLKQALRKMGCYCDSGTMLDEVEVATSRRVISVLDVSPYELGFTDGAPYKDICEKARLLGLELCPAEAGPQLRLQYDWQPLGEWVAIAMEPIMAAIHPVGPSIFIVENNFVVGLQLNRMLADPSDGDYNRHKYIRWIFHRPNKAD